MCNKKELHTKVVLTFEMKLLQEIFEWKKKQFMRVTPVQNCLLFGFFLFLNIT